MNQKHRFEFYENQQEAEWHLARLDAEGWRVISHTAAGDEGYDVLLVRDDQAAKATPGSGDELRLPPHPARPPRRRSRATTAGRGVSDDVLRGARLRLRPSRRVVGASLASQMARRTFFGPGLGCYEFDSAAALVRSLREGRVS